MPILRPVLLLLLATSVCAAAPTSPAAPPVAPPAYGAVAPLQLRTNWRKRAMSWFKAIDKKGRKAEMKAAGKALKRGCKHCHTKEGFTEKRLITRQMMALTVENDVSCADCHGGRDTLTEMGQASYKMFEVSRQEGVFCDECHSAGGRFKTLTPAGSRFEKAQKAKKTLAPIH